MRTATVREFRDRATTLFKAAEPILVTRRGKIVGFFPFLDGLEAFRTQRDGRLSVTDAAIVAVARRRNAHFIATFDRDFRRVRALSVVPA